MDKDIKVLNEEELLEKEDVREKFLDRIELLEKVKSVALLPNTDLMTTRMVAEYFEVGQDVIRKTIERNKDEIVQNGMVFKKHREIKEMLNRDIMSQLKISPRGTNVFTKRAVLNLGMLLRDSEVAKELRKNMLDTYEAAPDEVKTFKVDTEQKLLLDVIYTDDEGERAVALSRFNQFKNQHINRLEKVITEQEPKVKIHDQLVATVNVVDMIVTGKNIGIGEKKLFEFLRATNVLFKQGGDNIPYQQYQNNGYFEVKTVAKKDKYGREYRYYTTKVTGKGKMFIANLVDKYGGSKVINKLKLKDIQKHVNEINKQ